MKFPMPFIIWIYSCLSTPYFSIIVNGVTTGYFKSSQGLRQGDPISSYLFIILMECLTLMIEKEVSLNLIATHPKCKNPLVTSLMFADDVLLVTKPDPASIENIILTLVQFHKLTGLTIDKCKSQILVVGISPVLQQQIVHLSGIQVMPPNSNNLGLPISLSLSRIMTAMCMKLYEKVIIKLRTWPTHYCLKLDGWL